MPPCPEASLSRDIPPAPLSAAASSCVPRRAAAPASAPGVVASGRSFDSYPVDGGGDALFVGAMGAAEKCAARFNAVADDFAAAMLAFRSQRVDRALEAIEIAGAAIHVDLKRLVVVVSA